MGRKGGAPIGNKNGMKHGAYALQRALQARKIDGRSSIGQALKRLRTGFEAALGGDLSPQRSALLDEVVFKVVILQSVREWAFARPRLLGRGGLLPPILARCYLSWSDSLARNLSLLGLERVARDLGDDPVVLARKLAQQQEEQWRREREADEKQSEDGDEAEA